MTKKASTVKKGKGTKAEKAAKVEKTGGAAESKAAEVIAPVPVALLEAHPSLPSTERWLALFADHYEGTAARHAVIEAELATAAPEPRSRRERTPSRPALHLETAETSSIEVAADLAVESEFDLFAELAAEEQRTEASDDLLARLAQGTPETSASAIFEGSEFEASGPAEHSDPFLAAVELPEEDEATRTFAAVELPEEDEATRTFAAVELPEDNAFTVDAAEDSAFEAGSAADEGATRTFAAFTDEEEAEPAEEVPQFAEPSESTVMIAALTDEQLAALEAGMAPAPAADAAVEAAAKPKKSRKSSKKKKA